MMTARLLTPALVLLASNVLDAQDMDGSPFSMGHAYQPSTDIDDGGELSTHTYYLRSGLPIIREPGKLVAVTARYQWTKYDFDGTRPGSFGTLDPWDETHALKFGLPVFLDINEDWTLFALPSISLNFEDGADVGDSITGGFLGGAAYQFSDTLSIGPGFGVQTHLEESTSVFPLVYLDWQVSDNFQITTRPSGGIIGGPGITANWTLSESWRASFGAHYERLRFRLSESNTSAPEGVGEYEGLPVFASLTFQPTMNLHLGVFGGVRFANELRLENSNGSTLMREDADPTPFFGVNVSLHF